MFWRNQAKCLCSLGHGLLLKDVCLHAKGYSRALAPQMDDSARGNHFGRLVYVKTAMCVSYHTEATHTVQISRHLKWPISFGCFYTLVPKISQHSAVSTCVKGKKGKCDRKNAVSANLRGF